MDNVLEKNDNIETTAVSLQAQNQGKKLLDKRKKTNDKLIKTLKNSKRVSNLLAELNIEDLQTLKIQLSNDIDVLIKQKKSEIKIKHDQEVQAKKELDRLVDMGVNLDMLKMLMASKRK